MIYLFTAIRFPPVSSGRYTSTKNSKWAAINRRRKLHKTIQKHGINNRKQIHNANKQTNKQTNKHAKNIKHIGRVIIKFNNERTY